LPYSPFALGSVNLITSASNSGKTRFLKEIVERRERFFQHHESISRVVYINANGRSCFTHPWIREAGAGAVAGAGEENEDSEDPPYLPLEVVSLALEDLNDPSARLRPRDIVIFDDLLQISDSVDYVLKFAAHHTGLFVFLVTQSCLSSPLYRLVQSAHNVLLLFGNSGSTRLAQHIIQTFFFCSETKAYLKAILGIAERQQDTVLLKLNSVASYRPHSHVLALSRLQGLFEEDPPYCFLYPELGHAEHLSGAEEAAGSKAMNVGELPQIRGQFLEQAYVLLPASRIRQTDAVRSAAEDDAGENGDDELSSEAGLDGDLADVVSESTGKGKSESRSECLKEKRRLWTRVNAFLKREIEETFPIRRWNSARNLTRELLRSKQLCVTPDGRTVFVRGRPKLRFGIIDFVNVASRKAGPAEIQSDKVLSYVPLVNILLKNNVPETFIVNRVLLSAAQSGSRGAAAAAKKRGRRPSRGGRRGRMRRAPLSPPAFRPHHRHSRAKSGFGRRTLANGRSSSRGWELPGRPQTHLSSYPPYPGHPWAASGSSVAHDGWARGPYSGFGGGGGGGGGGAYGRGDMADMFQSMYI